MRTVRLLFPLFLLLLPSAVFPKNGLRVVWYNVENLFDTRHDSLHNDLEFTPEGKRSWTSGRYYNKLNQVARVLIASGHGELPALVGMAEVENYAVLRDLLRSSPLKTSDYRVLHFESPDVRGIDVALLYRPAAFRLLEGRRVGIRYPDSVSAGGKTRDLLVATGVVPNGDTLSVLLCHAPSKRGGAEQSLPKRMYVMQRLRAELDAVQAAYPGGYLLVMGDFNDTPESECLRDGLRASLTPEALPEHGLYNMAARWAGCTSEGSYKYKAEWSMIDQMMASAGLLRPTGLYVLPDGLRIMHDDFLLMPDTRYLGSKPRRSYSNQFYDAEGFSDHLPIYLDIRWQSAE